MYVSPITGITSCLEFSQQVSGPSRTRACQRRKLPAYPDTRGSISLTPVAHNWPISLPPEAKGDKWKE